MVRGMEESLWHTGRATAVRSLETRLAPDVVIHGGYWDGRVVRGIDEARQCFAAWREAFPTAHVRMHAVFGSAYGHGHRAEKHGVNVALTWSLLLLHQVKDDLRHKYIEPLKVKLTTAVKVCTC